MSNEEIKALAFDLIDNAIKCPYDYTDENREDLLVIGEVYGIVRMCDAICEREEQEEQE